MIIKRSIYNKILTFCPVVPPETGGILGSHNDTVDTVCFDKGAGILEAAIYVPDIEYLNRVIEEWQENGTEFCGIFHSHLKGQEKLSKSDIDYINSVFEYMPEYISELYFPIVMPGSDIISYKAVRYNHNVEIVDDILKLID